MLCILVGKRSLKMTSTTSWLIFLSFLHHHHHPCHHLYHHHSPLPPLPPGHEPFPSIEGCGLNHQYPGMHKMDNTCTCPSHLPLSFPKGYGQAHTCLTRELGRENTKGDLRNGRPIQCVTKMGYDKCCSLFFSLRFIHHY